MSDNTSIKKQFIIFTDRYPYGTGESFFENELSAIARQYKQVIIFPFDSGKSNIFRSVPENVVVLQPVYLNFKNKKELIFKGLFNRSPILPFIKEFFTSKCWKSGHKTWNLFSYSLVARTLIKKLRKNHQLLEPDVTFYFYWGLRWSQVVPFLGEEFKNKVLVRFHGSDLYEHTNFNYIPFREKQLQRLDRAVFVSEMGRRYLTDKYPFTKEKSAVARLGTKDFGLNPFRPSDEIHLVSCSNVVALKRLHLIASCLTYFDTKVKWTHLGDGPLLKEIEESVKGLPSNVEVHLTGALSHKELMAFYAKNQVSLFLNVSSTEGVPVSIMEALSFGIPVIATDVGGTHEIIDNTVGCLIKPNVTPQELTFQIKEIAYNQDYLILRANARSRWESVCNENSLMPLFVEKLLEL